MNQGPRQDRTSGETPGATAGAPGAERPKIVHGPLRWVLLALGWIFVGLAVAGVALPILPTTPFLLVAAACFARSSEGFYDWLVTNRIFGPLIRDWQSHRAIRKRPRWTGIVSIVVVLGSSVVFFAEATWLRVLLLATGVALVTFLYRLPAREDFED